MLLAPAAIPLVGRLLGVGVGDDDLQPVPLRCCGEIDRESGLADATFLRDES